MTLGSLFDGSGGFPLAGVINGITPVWASEIEPYPLRVTAQRFPNMQQLGDVTKINGAEIPKVDIITFGSPCQDLSVAGAQKGIHDGARSSLFFEAVRIIKEMRASDRATGRADEHCRPRFAVWENVPGAFSSNKGKDFQAVLQAFCDVCGEAVSVPGPPKGKWANAGCIVGDGYSIAWRVYDAQYWGVPQRRKRIYLVADFASERAGEILFESEGMRGDSAQGGEAREGTSYDAEGGTGRGCGIRCLNPWDSQTERVYDANYVHPALSSNSGAGQDRHAVVYEVRDLKPVFCLQANGIDRVDTAGCNGCGWRTDQSFTLNTIDRHAVAFDCRNKVYPERTGALCANSHPGSYTGQDAFNDMLPVIPGKPPRKYIVRRLTPLECCRLQGFPDWWEDGVEGSDSARYKMWGNGIALPCAVDVLGRIAREVTT